MKKKTYEVQVRFQIRVRDLAIFEKVGCEYSGVRRLNFFFIICIFYIFLLLKYSLKTHYMSLVHKTKKEEGKKHKTKKKTQKKQQIFKIKLRNDRFRMFGPHSKSIPVVSAQDSRPISACFSRWPIDPIRHIKTRFWSNQPGSVGISLNRCELELSWRKSIKKKQKTKKQNSDMRPTRG